MAGVWEMLGVIKIIVGLLRSFADLRLINTLCISCGQAHDILTGPRLSGSTPSLIISDNVESKIAVLALPSVAIILEIVMFKSALGI